ncbi:hypothetical protein ScPMuIL_012520 [Solemya velum]
MVKCRLLLQENEDLGKVIASGRTAKLEGEIALQKQVVQDMKKNQTELDEFLADLEEEVEGMQSMIYILQQQLIETKEQVTKLQQENDHLRTSHTNVPESDNYPNKKSCTPEWTEKDSQHKQETDLDLTVSSSEQWGKSRDTDSRDRESPLKGISETVVDTSSMEMDHEVSDHQIRTKIEEMETEPCMETDGQNCITNHSDVADSITKYENTDNIDRLSSDSWSPDPPRLTNESITEEKAEINGEKTEEVDNEGEEGGKIREMDSRNDEGLLRNGIQRTSQSDDSEDL